MRRREPDAEKVYAICTYLCGRNLQPCKRCPSWKEFPDGERYKPACFAMGEEVVNIVETGNPWGREGDG